INVAAKQRCCFSHIFRQTYLTVAVSPASYQSTDYPLTFYNHSSYCESISIRDT
ncbi:unnamed protein product, partial [Rotaria sp. Silwood2]